jgi:D-apiose dehydrogenase
MENLRFAIFGTGFWANYQIPGWLQNGGCECVAAYNRTVSKAETIAEKFGIPKVYADPAELLDNERIHFLDICTDVDTHPKFVQMAAERKIPVVCQKPLAPTLAQAEAMLKACQDAGVPLYVNENFRWQTPMRELKKVLESGVIGKPFRARVDMISGFPVFQNQPFLAELEQFIITDLGSHTLDATRFLFGEATSLYCNTQQVHSNIKGEDVATIVMTMDSGVTAIVEMAYAENYLEHDKFPETRVFVEGSEGSVLLDLDFWVRVTTKDGTHAKRHAPPKYDWIDPEYAIVHSSIAACQKNLLDALRGDAPAETSGAENIKTVRLVFASYDSAAKGQALSI